MPGCEAKKERSIKRSGLSQKLSLMVILVALFVFIPSNFFVSLSQFNEAMSELEQYKQALTIRIQNAFEPAIWNYDVETLRKLLSNELKDRKLKSVRIMSKEKKLIWLTSEEDRIIETLFEPEGTYIERREIPVYHYDDKSQTIATATVWFDNSESRNRFFRSVRNQLLETSIIIIIMAGSIAITSHIRLVKPLEAIRKSMIESGKSLHNLAREKLESASFRRAFPEIARMAEDFEHMLEDIDIAYEQVKESEAQFKAIFQQAGVGVTKIDSRSGRYLLVNQRFCEIVGYKEEELLELTFDKITHPDDLVKLEVLWENLLSEDRRKDKYEKRYIRKDGKIVWTEVTVTSLLDDNQMPHSQIAIIQDITLRKRAEEEIRKLNDELEHKVAERTYELECANMELEATIEDLRNAESQLIHHEKMAVLGQLVSGIAHEINTPLGVITSSGGTLDRIIKDEIDQVIEFCKGASYESMKFYKDLLHVGLNFAGAKDNSLKRKLRKKYYNLIDNNIEVSGEVIERLVDIGYECEDEEFLNLIQQSGISDAVYAAYSIITMHNTVNMIKISADKASKVIRALKTYSHKETNEQVVPHDVINDIEMVLVLYYNQTKHGVEIIKSYEEVPPVLCFPDKLHQIWVNIINNALHAMNYKGVLTIQVARDNDTVKVSISNTGPEIPDSIRDRIFEPFFTTKKLGEGTGLGLDIVKRTLDEIGGRINFESIPGRTTFNVWLRT